MAQMNPKLKKFWLTPARIKVLYGGRASSKTWDASANAIRLSRKYKMKFLCTRQFQNRIAESVYSTLKAQIERFGVEDEFVLTNNRILHKHTGSEFIFLGLWRSIDEIKSLEGVDVLWCEESHNITKEQFDILEPTIRKEGSQIWIIFNPRSRTDFVYKNFVINKRPNSLVQKINYTDNPFLSNTMLELIESKRDDEDFAHIYLGEPTNTQSNSLFGYEELERAMSGKHTPELAQGVRVYGLDVARFGDDSTVLAIRNGLVIDDLQIKTKLSTTEVASWLAYECNNTNPDALVIDTIGIGAGVFDQVVNVISTTCIEGNAGMKADNPKYFNKRTEMYFKLKEALKRGLCLPKDDDLLEELVSTTYTYTDKGQVKLESKDKIKENLGRSPDKADAVALTFFTTVAPRSIEQELYADTYVAGGAW